MRSSRPTAPGQGLPLLCTLVTLLGGCELREPLGLTIVELETQPCLLPPQLSEESSCGARLRAKVSGGRLPGCLAVHQGQVEQAVPLLADRETLVFSPADSAPTLSLSGDADQVELKLFYLGAVADPVGVCTPERFSVNRACADDEACILATRKVEVSIVEGEYNRIHWGPEGLECSFECRDASLCGSESGSATELCDGRDNDCDGTVDEGPVERSPEQQACPALGVCINSQSSCDAGNWVCQPPPEYEEVEGRCDGLDNDCDGEIDEDDAGGGEACETGNPGICGPGVQHCIDAELSCVPDEAARPETCDGRDEDCDGSFDEDSNGAPLAQACYSGPTTTRDVGACRGGQTLCEEGAWAEGCEGETLPAAERPDGLDNDCSGQADNGFFDLLFDGLEDHAVGVPPSDALDLTGRPFTLEAWIKPAAQEATPDRVILARRSPETGSGYSLSIHYPRLLQANGYLRLSLYRAGVVDHFLGTGHPVEPNRWQHLVVAWSPNLGALSSSLWILLDGISTYLSAEVPMEFPSSDAPLLIGADNRHLPREALAGAPFLGSIAGVRIQEGTGPVDATRDECQQHGDLCAAAPTVFPPCAVVDQQTIVYWPLRVGDGDKAVDLGPNGLHGDIEPREGGHIDERWRPRPENDPYSECLLPQPTPPEGP